MIRNARTPLTATLKCVKTRISSLREGNLTNYIAVLLHDNCGYYISKTQFSERELNEAKWNDRYFQLVNSGGIRSICDII